MSIKIQNTVEGLTQQILAKLASGCVVKEGGEHWQQHRLDVVEGRRSLEVCSTNVGIFALKKTEA